MKTILAAVLAAACLQGAFWYLSDKTLLPPDVDGTVDYLSYSPYAPGESPEDRAVVGAEQLNADLGVIAKVAGGLRTYSVIDGVDRVPEIAARHGLAVMLGAWVGESAERDTLETNAVVALAREHRNVRALLVGNEVLLREERTADELIALIREVKRQVRVPVSTGEIWYTWLQNPQLVNAVDFLAVHILPYWEGVPAEEAVAYTFDRLEDLRAAYPGKRIVIAEFGWPSQGYNNRDAVPGPLTQAEIIRQFLVEAERRGVEYNVVEAFDQTWKTNEGSVGAYWGIFDAHRQPKFALLGSVTESLIWKALFALAVGAALTWGGLRRRNPTLGHALVFAVAANGLSAGLAAAVAYPFVTYMNVGTSLMWAMGVLLMIPITLMTLAKVHEIGEVLLGRTPKRLIDPQTPGALPGALPAPLPKVSIHVPAYREPAEMVIKTLDSLAVLDYPNFEALIIVNNTPEAEYKAPVAARCAELGPRFKYLDIVCTGFKAGALNIALEHTDPEAEIIAVIDADYAVEPDWLKDLAPAFAEPKVALVQAPQDHRDGEETLLKTLMNSEYAGFFDIGMIQRNEDNAIIQHGTMCMVRRSALDEVGGWGTDTIVEDTELGLRLFEAGYQALYTNHRYGRGLLPDTYRAFKTQRFRWAYGAIQIMRKHWRHVMPGSTTLSGAQKFHFLTGWSFWLSDALGVCAAVLNLAFMPAVLFIGVVIPPPAFTLTIMTAFLVSLLHCALLYGKRVGIPLRQVPGAALAAMSLQYTVAQAVLTGLIKDRLAFARTEKGGNAQKSKAKKRGDANPARWETVLGVLLAASAIALLAVNRERVVEINIFAATLAVQSLPFLSTSAMVLIERLETWRTRRRMPAIPALRVGVGAKSR
jgi:exo-beta-1,3-glucanase (GH17 family)/cellulose synthase/poly-beta-1,6-N-acetylglucosamine synthase-like glycosyltransferase